VPTKTNIEWTDLSCNPLRARHDGKRGWSCAKTSPGCLNCYSEAINRRFGNGLDYDGAGVKAAEHYLEMKELGEILRFRPKPPFKNGRSRCMVFPFDMTDVFGAWVPDHVIDTFMAVVALRPDVDFMVLTKRADRLPAYFNSPDLGRRVYVKIANWLNESQAKGFLGKQYSRVELLVAKTARSDCLNNLFWPMPLANWWQGVSAEDQTRANHRLPKLCEANVAVRFASFEPLLGEIAATDFMGPGGLDLGIIGGESGSGARPCKMEWIRSLIAQHKEFGAACFVKQLGSKAEEWNAAYRPHGPFISNTMAHSKGGDPSEWHPSLRVREFPSVEVPR
jgi:protein gp37